MDLKLKNLNRLKLGIEMHFENRLVLEDIDKQINESSVMKIQFLLTFRLFLISFSLLSHLMFTHAANLDVADFGAQTKGGIGGEIIRVTNLNGEGPGSLRAALEEKGSRVVVFEVGGVIDLDQRNLNIKHPFITVAGQTAPSPGITIIKGGISISGHDVVIQHIRVRPGDAGNPKKSGWSPDGISTNGAYNVLLDHCSCTWAVDENLSVSGPRLEGPEATSHEVTLRHCIIAEGLDDSSHNKGPHSKGTLIHDYCRKIAVIGNLYAHNVDRNPYFKAFTTGVIVNNLIYNPGRRAINVNYSDSEWEDSGITPENCRIAAVGNVVICGIDSSKYLYMIGPRGDVYMEDNLSLLRNGKPGLMLGDDVNKLNNKPVWLDGLQPISAERVEDYVLQTAGARPSERDAIDKRIVDEVRKRQGRIINSQDDVGGYPIQEMVKRPLDVPENNIEEWLEEMAYAVEVTPTSMH